MILELNSDGWMERKSCVSSADRIVKWKKRGIKKSRFSTYARFMSQTIQVYPNAEFKVTPLFDVEFLSNSNRVLRPTERCYF